MKRYKHKPALGAGSKRALSRRPKIRVIAATCALAFQLAVPRGASLTAAPIGQQDELQLVDHTYLPSVHTAQLFKTGFEMAPPIIELNGTETLTLRFDDFRPVIETMSYTVLHCNASWEPSDLMPSQYLTAAMSDLMPTGEQSFNTLQQFIEYEVTFPNQMLQIGRSGNYLLKVFRNGDENDLVLTRRFLVYEQVADITARVLASRQVDQRDIAQQVDLTIRTDRLPMLDPFGDLHVTILQNMRWDDARTELRPRYIRGTELIYDMPEQGLFLGGNEYRNFDLKNLRYATQRVARIEPGPGEQVYQAYLLPEERRTIRLYHNQQDLNGRYLVRNDQVDGDPLGADYVNVHVELPMEAPLYDPVYIYGGLSDFQCRDAFQMTWTPEKNAYTANVLLKQGFYDMSFVTLPRGSSVPDISAIEGSHYQTENEYLVLVYFSDRQQRCDRLVGLRFLNSRR